MNHITVRDMDDRVYQCLLRIAEEEGISPDEAARKLLYKAAELPGSPSPPRRIGKSLDHFVGSMTPEESAELKEALEFFHTIDESMWQ